MLKKVKRIKLDKEAYRRLMRRVLDRDGWRCQKWGSFEHLQVHHRIYRSQQGDDKVQNLVTLCAYCHLEEHGNLTYSHSVQKLSLTRSPSKRLGRLWDDVVPPRKE